MAKRSAIAAFLVLLLISLAFAGKKHKAAKADYWFVLCDEAEPDKCIILTTAPTKAKTQDYDKNRDKN
jgi:hypothetical protein